MNTDSGERGSGLRDLARVLQSRGAAVGSGGADFLAAVSWNDEEELSELLRAARADGVAMVTVGARSRLGRMGMPDASARRVRLDGSGCRGILALDSEALWLRVRAGTTLREAQQAAAEKGLRLAGVAPEDPGTVGGWLAVTARIPDPLLASPIPPALGVAAVLPDGTPWRSIIAPRAACGPDGGALFFGTGGAFGVLTEAALRLDPPGALRQRMCLHLSQPALAGEVLRQAVLGPLAPVEGRALIWVDGRGARVEVVFEGPAGLVEEALRALRDHAELAGARELRSGDGVPLPAGEDGPPARGVRWSQLSKVLAEFNLPAVDALMLDRPESGGCRLRVLGGDAAALAVRLRLFLDPDGRRRQARAAEFEWLRRVKRELDPGGLLNPQALPWLEREVCA